MNATHTNETAEMLVTVTPAWQNEQGFRLDEIPTAKPCAHLYQVYDRRDVPIGEITHRDVYPDARPFYFSTLVNGVWVKSQNYSTLEDALDDFTIFATSLGF